MSDTKYGPIFTSKDLANVLAVLGITDTPGINEAIRRVQSSVGLTFPLDEPVFVLRAQDQAAPATLAAYTEAAQFNGASADFVNAATATAIEFVQWQNAPANNVKVPD